MSEYEKEDYIDFDDDDDDFEPIPTDENGVPTNESPEKEKPAPGFLEMNLNQLKLGSKFRFTYEPPFISRTIISIGPVDVYAPMDGQDTSEHTVQGGEERYERIDTKIIVLEF